MSLMNGPEHLHWKLQVAKMVELELHVGASSGGTHNKN